MGERIRPTGLTYTQTFGLVGRVCGHVWGVTALATLNDELLCSGGADGFFKVWRLPDFARGNLHTELLGGFQSAAASEVSY